MDEHLEKGYLDEELYEKQVVRQRKRKAILISSALSVFLVLCGLPVVQERMPKWKSLRAAREIAHEIQQVKTHAIREKKPVLLTVFEGGTLKMERVDSCKPDSMGVYSGSELLREGVWNHADRELTLLGPLEAKQFKLSRLVQQICYDPVLGVPSPETKKVMMIVPVKDLTDSKLDRASFVEVDSSVGKVSIN